MSLTEANRILEEKLPRGFDPAVFYAHCASLKRVVILRTSWYPEVVDSLVLSAKKYLLDNKVNPEAIEVLHVPGAFELPLAVELCLKNDSKQVVDLVIALGCVVNGETPHFDFVCQAVSRGIMDVQIKHGRPVGFGVLTVNTMAQALSRKDKGAEAAQAALAMSLLRSHLNHHPLTHTLPHSAGASAQESFSYSQNLKTKE